MSACIALRDDYDSLALRDLARRSRDPRQLRRLLALGGGIRRHEPHGSGEGRRYGSPDTERLGASLQ